MSNDINTVNVLRFLDAAFPVEEMKPDEVVGICRGIHRCVPHDTVEETLKIVSGEDATYVVVSTLDGRKRITKDGAESSDLGRARANCREAWLFVLDDIGTKSSTPAVEPSYKMVTSIKDGVENYQWGYFLEPFDVSTDYGVAYYEGACRAAGEAGISDPGMRGVYRICRVPGSLHSSGFRAEIRSWNPERVFELGALCLDLGLDVDAAMKPVPKTVSGEDFFSRGDVVLDWLQTQGGVTGVVNGDWVEIQCPNSGAHTDGSVTAGYSPLDYRREGRQFKCFHGHCSELDTGWFLDWVAESGGPAVGATESFYMSDSARANIQKAIKTALPPAVVSDMDSGDARDLILRDWYLCEASGLFVHYVGVAPKRFVTTAVFNSIHAIDMPVGKKGGRVMADKWWAVQPGRKVVNDVVWRPDRAPGMFTDESGMILLNAYVPYVPEGIRVDAGVSYLWDKHLDLLFGSDAELLKQWMGWLVQHPDQRINWAPVIQGIEGCGKSLIGQALAAALGRQYVVEVGPNAFADAYNTFMEGKLLVLGEEIRVSGQNRYAVMDTLKTLLTNDWIDVRGMRVARRTIQNTTSYMIFTNHDDALPLEYGNRRWTIMKARIQTSAGLVQAGMTPGYFSRLAESCRKDAGAIYGWLSGVDVSAFDPKGRAPITEGTEEMIYDTTDELYRKVLEYVISGAQEDANELVFTNVAINKIVDLVERKVSSRSLPTEGRWRSYLRGQGWAVIKQAFRNRHGEITRVWVNSTKIVPSEQTSETIHSMLETGNLGAKNLSNIIDISRRPKA